jgi:hypothetical protein
MSLPMKTPDGRSPRSWGAVIWDVCRLFRRLLDQEHRAETASGAATGRCLLRLNPTGNTSSYSFATSQRMRRVTSDRRSTGLPNTRPQMAVE